MSARLGGLFPGQLSEKAGMGEALALKYPYVAELFETVSNRSGVDLPATFFFGAASPTALHDDLPAQTGVFAVSLAALDVLEREHGVVPRSVAGYSLGTYAAFAAAGAMDRWAALDVLLEAQRLLEEERIEGGMGFVIGLSREALEGAIRAIEPDPALLSIGTENAGAQFILTGAAGSVAKAIETLAPTVLRAERLPIRWPMHSPLLRPVADRLWHTVSTMPLREPRRAALHAPMLGRVVEGEAEAARVLGRQIAEPSRWADTLRAMGDEGTMQFAEIGPGDVLTRLLRWTLRGAQGVVLEEPDGIAAFAAALAVPVPSEGRP